MDSVTFNFLIRSIQLRPSWRLRESKFVIQRTVRKFVKIKHVSGKSFKKTNSYFRLYSSICQTEYFRNI